MTQRARAFLERIKRDRGVSFTELSLLLGRNEAYIQQFVRRRTPQKLKPEDRCKLANHLGVDEYVFGEAISSASYVEFDMAAAAIRHALSICDSLGLSVVACHLQMGLDLMDEELAALQATLPQN